MFNHSLKLCFHEVRISRSGINIPSKANNICSHNGTTLFLFLSII